MWWIVGSVVLLAAVATVVLIRDGPDAGSARTLTPVTRFGDVHGLAVDPDDASVLYVATHHGLMRGDGTGWYRVGDAEDDYMGFTMHPTDGDTFWTSGHPRRGGNIGVQQSTDGGYTWRVIALEGEADFHAMTVSPADPQRLWGAYRGQLYASMDGGTTWAVVDADLPQISALAADPRDADAVWAAGPAGILKSVDGGKTWGTVTGVAFQGLAIGRDGATIYAVGRGGGAKSADAGATWTPIVLSTEGAPAHVAVDPTDRDKVYVATYHGAMYGSVDGGGMWTGIETPA